MQDAGSAWDELKHIIQSYWVPCYLFSLLIIMFFFNSLLKYSHENVVDSWCWKSVGVYLAYKCAGPDDVFGMTSMAHTVCHQISFLLDDDSSDHFSSFHLPCGIPFSVDDISKSMEQIDISDIEPPPLIRETSGFMFLLPRVE
ncbi:hypothetical protein IFM89_029436 [Coptis chinensis]|uniref:Uncharacterized protein n=1 Tax=Coptis chinensis TaxID=261450 RepID=A0A835IT15_9MAGN|nr:hypothetical protein IFM89_029436 [Coptis chinensis]